MYTSVLGKDPYLNFRDNYWSEPSDPRVSLSSAISMYIIGEMNHNHMFMNYDMHDMRQSKLNYKLGPTTVRSCTYLSLDPVLMPG